MSSLSWFRRRRTPLRIQMESTECGAACLNIILAYYGRYVPMENLRIACGVSRDGSSAYGIVKAAELFGLDCEGYSYTIEELNKISLPVIVHWGFDHFVVLESIEKDRYYINDPSVGHIIVKASEFKYYFTGVVLILTPNASFKKGGEKPSHWQATKKRLQGIGKSIFFLSVTQLCVVFLTLVTTILAQIFVDFILNEKFTDWRWWFIGVSFVVFLFVGIISVLEKRIVIKLDVKLATQYAASFFYHIFALPVSFYEQRYASEIAYRSSLNQQVADSLTSTLLEAVIKVITAVIYGAAMFFYSPTIALVILLLGGLNLITVLLIHRHRLTAYAQYQQEMGRTAAFSISALDGLETWKSMGAENRLFSWLSTLYTKSYNVLHKLRLFDSVLTTIPHFVSLAAQTALYILGIWYIIEGTLTPGQFLALLMLSGNFLAPIQRLVEINQAFELFQIDVARLDDVMNHPIDWQYLQKVPASTKTAHLESIELRNVAYRYNINHPPIIHSINLKLEKGTRAALVGPSGSGKTTILKLMAGFIDPEIGEVLINNIPIKEFPQTQYTSEAAFIVQEPFLFEDTIKNNVTLYDNSIDQERINGAMVDACIWDRFSEEKNGLYAYVAEEGRNISGGERQRIEIARRLVRNPSFLILDEATAYLDQDTEVEVFNHIKDRGCTMLILTHRLSAINLCDMVYVLDKGTIVEQGSPQELAKRDGLFKKMLLTGE